MGRDLRRLTADDYDDIIRIWADAGLPYKPQGRDSRERVVREIEREDTALFGLFENGRMLAVGLATYDGRKGWIEICSQGNVIIADNRNILGHTQPSIPQSTNSPHSHLIVLGKN